jgi:hypothetical protein
MTTCVGRSGHSFEDQVRASSIARANLSALGPKTGPLQPLAPRVPELTPQGSVDICTGLSGDLAVQQHGARMRLPGRDGVSEGLNPQGHI